MKKYKFDIIRQNVMSWSPDIRENLSSPDELHCACPGPSCPWITLEEYIPSHDYYGETVDDIDEYIQQRNAYCKQLFKEIQKTQTHPVLNVIRHKLDRFLWFLDTFIFGYSLSSKLCCLRANIIHLFNKFKNSNIWQKSIH